MVRTVDNLKPGESATVIGYNIKGPICRKIRELGITRGSVVELEKNAPLGYPLLVNVRGFSLALGKEEAEIIQIE